MAHLSPTLLPIAPTSPCDHADLTAIQGLIRQRRRRIQAVRRRWDARRRALTHPRAAAAAAAGSRCPQRSDSRHLDATKGSVGLEGSGLASGSPNEGSVASRTGRERCLGAPVGERCLPDPAGARLERPGSDTAGERSQPLKSTPPLAHCSFVRSAFSGEHPFSSCTAPPFSINWDQGTRSI